VAAKLSFGFIMLGRVARQHMSGHGPVNLPSREVITRSRKQMLDENGLLIITLPSTSRSLLSSPVTSAIFFENNLGKEKTN
jgi:hypothetical protein